MNRPEADYNTWHTLHNAENDIDTPWHNFVKKVLSVKDINEKCVLEIGCGRGGFSHYIVFKYPAIKLLYACDYSESALEIGRAKFGTSKISWQHEDIQRLSFPDKTFDTVISCETIEHVPSPLKALAEMYRVLKPGGRLILTCPNYFNLFGIWCLYRKMIGKPYTEGGQPYVNYILIPAIITKIKRLGFKIDHFHSSEFVVPARVPKTFYSHETPPLLKYFGSRTFYVLSK